MSKENLSSSKIVSYKTMTSDLTVSSISEQLLEHASQKHANSQARHSYRRSGSAKLHKHKKKDIVYRSVTAADFRKQITPTNSIGMPLIGIHLSYSSNFGRKLPFKLNARGEDFAAGRQSAKISSEEELEKPKQSFWTMLRMGMVYFGIEMIFSIEVALAIPILLQLKVAEE